jgi:hypothetical protein
MRLSILRSSALLSLALLFLLGICCLAALSVALRPSRWADRRRDQIRRLSTPSSSW